MEPRSLERGGKAMLTHRAEAHEQGLIKSKRCPPWHPQASPPPQRSSRLGQVLNRAPRRRRLAGKGLALPDAQATSPRHNGQAIWV
eukprot:9788175-Alexandrium_andersonii.AAC.1